MGNKKPLKIKEELGQTQQDNTGADPVEPAGGLLAELRQGVAAVLTVPTRLRAWFTGRVEATWRFVTVNKMRLFLTIVLIATIIGAIGAVYLWRREIADFITWAIEETITRIRSGRFTQPDESVVIGRSINGDGVERTVFRVKDSGEF